MVERSKDQHFLSGEQRLFMVQPQVPARITGRQLDASSALTLFQKDSILTASVSFRPAWVKTTFCGVEVGREDGDEEM